MGDILLTQAQLMYVCIDYVCSYILSLSLSLSLSLQETSVKLLHYTLSLQGFAAHVSPFTEIRDIGGLLTHCGFTMLTIVSYSL